VKLEGEMTRQEYIAKQQTMRRLEDRRQVCWLVVFFCGGLLGVGLLSIYLDQQPKSLWMGWLCLASMGVIALMFMVLAILVWHQRQREFGMRCRYCGKQIRNSRKAIATGNCGFCGEKLFD
jgi:Na+/proline symporter